MSSDPAHIADITYVQGDTLTAAIRPGAAPGLTFSRGQAYFVGQVGAYVRIPLGLADLFAIIDQVGSSPLSEDAPEGAVPGRSWLRMELLGEAHRGVGFQRGVARYPSIGDRVMLVTADDLKVLHGVNDPARMLNVGSIANAPHLPAVIDAGRMISRHVAVVGSTGSGKSTSVAHIVSRVTARERFPSARVLVVDVHGEYSSAFGAEARRLGVDLREEGGGTNQGVGLYLPYWALAFEDFLNLALGEVDENSAVVIQQLVVDAKRQYVERHGELGLEAASVTADSPVPFSVRGLWFTLHEMQFATHTATATAQHEGTRAYACDQSGAELRGDAEALLAPTYQPAAAGRLFLSGAPLNARRQTNSLRARLQDPRYDFLFRPGKWDVALDGETQSTLAEFLELWLGGREGIVIADLSGVPNQVLQRVVGVLLRLLYEALIWARGMSMGGRARPLFIVLEEAHRYLNEARDGAGVIVERIVKEGRKFGVGVMLVSQRPSEIRSTVLSQVGSFVVLRLANGADRSLVRQTLPDNLSGIFAAVPVLRTGEAILIGEMVKLPTRVLFEVQGSQRPDSGDPEIIGQPFGGWEAPRGAEDYGEMAWAWAAQRGRARHGAAQVTEESVAGEVIIDG